MELEKLSMQDLCEGYLHDVENERYVCGICGTAFQEGEIFPVEGRLFEAKRAVQEHLWREHGDYLHTLIDNPSKYNTLTENQRQMMKLFAAGQGDKEIAKELGIAASTVRHQRFVFREKAKQAKLYLAIYERAFGTKGTGKDMIVPIHEGARMVDERYVITEEERNHVLETLFSSLSPLRLETFSRKEKKKIVILTRISEEFEKGREYTEKEVNAVLSDIFDDYVTLRRYLIEYGFMQRVRDGSKYWRP